MPFAQSAAVRRLTYLHPKEYRKLYLEAKEQFLDLGRVAGSKAQGIAREKLRKKYQREYRKLYLEYREKGYKPNSNTKKGSVVGK